MALRELVEQELSRAQGDVQDLLNALESAKISASRTAYNDSDSMMAGVGLAHAALEIAKLRTKYDAAREHVSILKYLLRKDSEEQAASESK